MKMLLFMPLIFIMFSQPFTLSLVLTMQTSLTSMMIYILTKNTWMALMLTLVMVGGLMISFVYMSSLIPTEPYTRTYTWMSPIVMFPFIFMVLKPFIYQMNYNFYEYTPINMFNSNTYSGTMLIVGILMMTLLMVCVNTLQVKCPMRSYN